MRVFDAGTDTVVLKQIPRSLRELVMTNEVVRYEVGLGVQLPITNYPINNYRLMMRMFCQSYANFLPQSKHTM